jgi:spoIIIJ-associated protein
VVSGSAGDPSEGGVAGIGGARIAGSSGQSVDVSAKTVEDAVARALRDLGCTRDDVRVDVLNPGNPGRLLGFGAEPARVRVTVVAGVADPEAPETASATAAVRAGSQVGTAIGGAAAILETDDTAQEGAGGAALEVTEEDLEETEHEEGEVDATDAAQTAQHLLADVLAHMGMHDLHVDVVTVEPLALNIRGGDVADLIGRRGENLRALQFILSLMLNKQLRRHLRVTVDVDGYRARREDLLRNMAARLAQRVRATREAMPLEAMPPNERRIIHIALADDPDVMTESVGEGDARRVVIKPHR